MLNPSSTRDKSFWLGLSFGVLLVFGAINLLALLYAIPRFEEIFQDTLPGKPLPSATVFFIGSRLILALLVAGWLTFCGIMAWRRSPSAILLINLGTVCVILQIVLIAIAMSMPMVSTTEALSNAQI